MKREESWLKFEQTGDIMAYLHYTACTSEDKTGYKKERTNDSDGNSDGNCSCNNTNR